jgi:hypothetical protein
LGLEHDLSDRVADELCDTAPGARRGHAQGVKFFFAEVNHVCHFTTGADVRQLGSHDELAIRKALLRKISDGLAAGWPSFSRYLTSIA